VTDTASSSGGVAVGGWVAIGRIGAVTVARGVADHPRQGLAAGTSRIGTMRTVIIGVDMSIERRK